MRRARIFLQHSAGDRLFISRSARRRSACRDQIFEIQSLGQISREQYPYFWRYTNVHKTYSRGKLYAKNGLIRVAVSTQYRRVTDTQTQANS